MNKHANSDNLKVLHVVEAFGGGIFSFLSDLTLSTNSNIRHIIVYTKRPEMPKNFRQAFPKSVKFIESKCLRRDINIVNEIKAIKEVRQIITKENPDVVHLHSSKAGVIGRIACINKKDIKVYYNPHGFAFLMQNTSALKRKIYYIAEKIMTFFPGTIIACSRGEYNEAKKLTKKCININNSLNLTKIDQEINKLSPHKLNIHTPTICTIGRIDYQKNPTLFNKIAAQNPNLHFIWIGDGNLKNKLTAENIEITGWLSRSEVLKKLNDSDIFILTSLWEGLPISLLEAMYMNKLCIVTDVIGNRDTIKNKRNGYIANSAKKYSDFIRHTTTAKYVELTKNAHSDIVEKYNFSHIAKEYEEAYNEIS